MTGWRLLFDWNVAAAGYRWIQTDIEGEEPAKPPELALVPLQPDPLPGDAKAADRPPEPDPDLFRRFAELKPDKEGILAFAKTYGDLVVSKSRLATGGEAVSAGPPQGTLLVTWQHQIADMQRLVGLWDLLQQEDRDQLAMHI